MIGVGFLVSVVLLFPCQGLITSPPIGTELTFLNGSTANITWSFDNDLSTSVSYRGWFFTSSDGSFNAKPLASINKDEKPSIEESGLSGVTIIKPATLILKNVNQTYDGTYQFNLAPNGGTSNVRVFIAKKPNVTLSCSSRNEVNEGDNFTCVCRGEGGNPPANVTWYKDGKQFGETRKENNTLTLSNVNEACTGNYTCEARSHTNDQFADEKSIQGQVCFEPNTAITFQPETAEIGSPCTVTCDSSGFPAPSHTITHNGIQVSTNKTYTIHVVKWSDAGIYKCFAKNVRGNDSASANLTVTEPPPTTTSPPTTTPLSTSSSATTPPSNTTSTTPKPPDPSDACPVWCIVIIVIAVVVVLVIIAYVVYRYKKKEKEGYSGNPEVSPDGSGGVNVNQYELDGELAGGVDNTYDTANPSGASGSKSKPPKNTLPPVYAAVDKSKKDGKQLYATLDTVALHSDNSKKKRDEERPGQSEYASIDFGKIGKADEE